jgi:ankyrin repeat-containing protein (fragment)
VTSALLQTWLENGDLDSIEAAIFEGHGETIKSQAESIANANVQQYLEHKLPKIINKIRMIHVAVSCGDLHGLEHYLNKKEYAFAKDQFGLSPLHKATIFGHEDVVQYLLDNFPETVHSKDREGRTALHYAAAANNKVGARILKMLLRNGANLKARDMVSIKLSICKQFSITLYF